MMRCCCNQSREDITLCDAHAREFHRRISDMRGPDDKAVWNAALDAVEAKLAGPNASPIDTWVKQRISLLRK